MSETVLLQQAQALRYHLHERKVELVDYLNSLVRAESPSLDPHSQQAMFRLLAEPLGEIGYSTHRVPGVQSGGMLFARPANRTKHSPCQLLLGHCDTVWPAGTLSEMPLEIDGNIMRGPGVYDMKAGLAQIVYAVRALHDLNFKPVVTPLILVSSDEELGSEDSRCLIERLAHRVCRVLVPEPSDGREGRLKTGRKGVAQFTVTIEGKAAHAGVEPEAGASAILELSYVIQKLHALNNPKRGLSVNVGTIEGGSRPNIVAPRSRAEVDVRFLNLADGQAVGSQIRATRPQTRGTRIQVRGGVERPPLEKTPRNRALWRQAQRLGTYLDLNLQETESGGGSDGNLTSPYTATLDGLGGVGGGAHARHEFIYLDKLIERTALLALLLLAPPVTPP